jgi:HKD family nuclease
MSGVSRVGLNVLFLESGEVLTAIKKLMLHCNQIDMAVAFLKDSGYQSIRSTLVEFLKRGNRVRIIVGLSGYCITDPEPLEDLLAVKDRLKRKRLLGLKYYSNTQFHPKILILRQNDVVNAIVGSSNFTQGGWGGNVEANVLIEGTIADQVIKDIILFFNKLWSGGAREITFETLNSYKAMKSKSYHWNKVRIRDEEIKKTHIPLPKFKAIEPDIAYILGMLSARGELFQNSVVIRIPCRGFAARREHMNFAKRELNKIIISSIDENAKIFVNYNNQTSSVEVSITSRTLLKIAKDVGIPVNINLGISGRFPKRILKEESQIIKSFLKGYGDSCATVDKHISGRARVVLNLLTQGGMIIKDLVDAFQKCSIPIADVNLPVVKGALNAQYNRLRRLLTNRVTITGGTKTPQVRFWGDEYTNYIGFRNTYIRRKLKEIL